jgi:hypothetical protein
MGRLRSPSGSADPHPGGDEAEGTNGRELEAALVAGAPAEARHPDTASRSSS